MRHPRRDARRRCTGHAGFALVELLVVAAILGILASLLLPALSQGKDRARSTLCKSNLRQQGVAITLHIGDHGAFPLEVDSRDRIPELETPHWSTDLWHKNYWFIQLDIQLRGRGVQSPDALFAAKHVFRCPSDPQLRLPWPDWHNPSFGYNARGLRYRGVGGTPPDRRTDLGLGGTVDGAGVELAPTRESEVVAPADMIAMGDRFKGTSDGRLLLSWATIERDWPSTPQGSGASRPDATLRDRHRGAVNLVVVDAHVEGPRILRVFFDRDDTSLQRWNRDHQPHRENLP